MLLYMYNFKQKMYVSHSFVTSIISSVKKNNVSDSFFFFYHLQDLAGELPDLFLGLLYFDLPWVIRESLVSHWWINYMAEVHNYYLYFFLYLLLRNHLLNNRKL